MNRGIKTNREAEERERERQKRERDRERAGGREFATFGVRSGIRAHLPLQHLVVRSGIRTPPPTCKFTGNDQGCVSDLPFPVNYERAKLTSYEK